MPWNGTMPDGGTSYCFVFAELVNSFCTLAAISISREKLSITWYRMSSKTKYWSSLVAVSWTSLNTSLSTIKSTLITFDLRNSQWSTSCKSPSSFVDVVIFVYIWIVYVHNYHCQVRSSRVRHAEALVFDPFSAGADRAAHAAAPTLFDIAPANCALSAVINRKILSSIRWDCSLAARYAQIPTWVGFCMSKIRIQNVKKRHFDGYYMCVLN